MLDGNSRTSRAVRCFVGPCCSPMSLLLLLMMLLGVEVAMLPAYVQAIVSAKKVWKKPEKEMACWVKHWINIKLNFEKH